MNGKRPTLDSSIPTCLKDLITKCWQQDIERRPSFQEIVNSLKDPIIYNEYLKDDNDEYKKYINYIK